MSRRALERACSLGGETDVTVITVLATPAVSARVQGSREAREVQQRLLEDARRFMRQHGTDGNAVGRVGNPAKEILAAVRDTKADLVVVGHGHRRFPHPGSVSAALVRRAECDVLLVHGGTAGADGRDGLAGDDR
jgi:nucleotide-binding universal stress UspA family protein